MSLRQTLKEFATTMSHLQEILKGDTLKQGTQKDEQIKQNHKTKDKVIVANFHIQITTLTVNGLNSTTKKVFSWIRRHNLA